MRGRSILKILILFLVIFWGVNFLSDILFVKGENLKPGNSTDFFKSGKKIFPLSSDAQFRYAYSLLSQFETDNNTVELKKSIEAFRDSIKFNQLNYVSYLYLGKALMNLNSPDPDIFRNGLNAIRKASYIRKSSINVNANTIEIYLSMWPFLSKEDREFTSGLLKESIDKLTRSSFNSILETWSLYSQDGEILQSIFNPRQKFYYETIKLLGKKQLLIKIREKLLAEVELKVLKDSQTKFNKSEKDENPDINLIKSIYKKLSSGFKGYNILIKNSKFREKTFNNLRKKILLFLIKSGLKKNDKNPDTEIYKYLNDYINYFTTISDLDDLKKLLSKSEFLNSADLNRQYIKYKIMYVSGQFSKVISELEKFRESLAFLKKEHIKEYSRILMLLADSYISSRLLTRAVDIFKEIEKISPGLTGLYWRLFKIEKVIGEDEFFKVLKIDNYKLITDSNTLILTSRVTRQDVYFYDKTSFSIVQGDEFEKKAGDFSVLQIFNGDRICAEYYKKDLQFPIRIDLPPDFKDRKITITVSIRPF